MQDNPIHTFFQFLVGDIPDQLSLGNLRWFTVALYWLILVPSIALALYNWYRDPSQRTINHLCVFAMRMVAAGMWYLGTLWKIPFPVAAGFHYWLAQTAKYSSFQIHADIMQFFVAHIVFVQPLVYLLEVFLTASLMLGFLVRFSGIVAALFTLNLLIGLYNDPTEWPWTYVGIICAHGMFAAAQAGRSLGLDNLVAKGMLPVFASGSPISRAVRWAS
jgi:hypothetical protein